MRKLFPVAFSFLLLALVFSVTNSVQANTPALTPGSVILTDRQGEYPLGLHLGILEDPTRQLTIEDITSPEYDTRFRPSQEAVPNFSFTDSAIWTRLRLRNEASLNRQWWLEVGFANMHYADLYAPSPDGSGFVHKQTGTLRPFASRDIPHHYLIFTLFPSSQTEQTFYLRFQSDDSLTLPLTLWSVAAFVQKDHREQLAVGLFYGVLLAILGYNFFLFLSLREKRYLPYLLFIGGILLFQVASSGRANQYFWPNLVAWSRFMPPLFAGLALFGLVSFTSIFLATKIHTPLLHRGLMILLAAWGLLTMLAPLIRYRFIALPLVVLAIVTCLTVFVAGLATWRQGYRPARYFVLAVLVFLIATISFALVRLGFLPSTPLTEDSPRTGMIWLVLLMSLALADRINFLKAEAEQSNRALRQSERRLSQFLDALPVGVIILDTERKLRYINQWVRHMFDYPKQTIQLGQVWDDITTNTISLNLAGSQEPYPPQRRPLWRALHGEDVALDDMDVVYQGRRIPLEVWAQPIFDEQGQVQYAISAFQDITERKQSAERLAATAVENARLFQQVQGHAEELERRVAERTAELAQETANLAALQHAIQEITTSLELEQVYTATHQAAKQLMPVDAFVIALLDEARQEIEDVYLFDRDQRWPNARQPLGRGLTSYVITTGQSLHLDDDCHGASKQDIGTELFGTDEDTCSVLAIPLRLGDQILGVISAQAYPAYVYTASHRQLLETLANQVSISIANARLYEQAQQEITERQRAEAALQQAHHELDMRIKQRTAELRQANTSLRAEIVERQRVEESLRQSEARNQALLNAIPDLILRLRRDGAYLDYKAPRDFPLFTRPEQFLNRTVFEVLPVEVAQEHMHYVERALQTGEVQGHEYQLPIQGELRYQEARVVASGPDEALVIIRDVHERKKAEEQLKASLKEKELLLQEIHHRVKNNLQIVISLLKFQARYINDPATHDLLQESQNRIRSMVLIHEKLYQSPDLARVNFADYVRSLTSYLFRSYGVDPSAYTLKLDVADVFLTIELGIPCGLIINELVSNSIKHAFPAEMETGREILVSLEPVNRHLKLTVGDNGVGLPADFEPEASGSLGLQLVNMLVEQLEGNITLEQEHGTMYIITFAAP